MKKMMVMLFLCFTLLTAFAGGRRETELKEVVIGFQAIPNGELVAKQLGWHEESFLAAVRGMLLL